MKMVPQNQYVLCEEYKETPQSNSNIVISNSRLAPLYKVLKISNSINNTLQLKIGDIVMTNSIPTGVLFEGQKVFIINIENISCKISE